MIAEELINPMIPPLKLTDTASKAVVWMEELRTKQLPVVNDGQFLGLISEDVILEKNDLEQPISSFELIAKDCSVNRYQHFYDILKTASDHKMQVVGVLDEENKYFGVITIEDTIASFSQTAAVQAPGGILVLSMRATDYSMAEIGRLVEENESKILSSSIREDPLDPTKIKLTLKVSKTDLSHIIATLERFDYKIIAKFQEKPVSGNEKEHLDILMKYLNI